MFYDVLEGKNACLGNKNNKFQKAKNWDFSKGLTRGFGPKMAIFPIFFFLGNIGQENVFYDILHKKNAFLAIKTSSSKSPKIEIFPKGLSHGFGKKNGHFSNYFFKEI